jgi:hypothetical protein
LLPLVVNALKEWRLACPKSKLDLVFRNGRGNVETHQKATVRDQIHKQFENDVLAWTVIAMIYGAVNLAMWATVLWEAI